MVETVFVVVTEFIPLIERSRNILSNFSMRQLSENGSLFQDNRKIGHAEYNIFFWLGQSTSLTGLNNAIIFEKLFQVVLHLKAIFEQLVHI